MGIRRIEIAETQARLAALPCAGAPADIALLSDGPPLVGERVIRVEDLDAGYGMPCPTPLDEETTERSGASPEAAYRALELADFGRVDIALDRHGLLR